MRVSKSFAGTWSAWLIAAAALATACGDSASPATTVPATTAATVAATSPPTAVTNATIATTVGSTAPASIDPQAPLTQTVDAKFDPPFTLRIPADWTAILRDRWAFQAYLGNEGYELTFDHTYQQKESVDEAIARLAASEGLVPGPITPIVVGGREGKGFVGDSESAVRFPDSGFHTNDASRLEVFAIPMDDGTTVTVFLTAGADPQHGVDPLGQLARRIFETVQWT